MGSRLDSLQHRSLWTAMAIFSAVVCSALALPTYADTAQAERAELKAETYTSGGKISGCGLSFLGTGISDGRARLGLSGSANVLWVQDERKLATMIKVGALADLKPAVIRLAWIETKDAGRSSGWITRQSGDPPMFLMIKEGDYGLPPAMADGGFTINFSMEGRPLDDSMRFPPAAPIEQRNLGHCIESLNRNLQAGAR